MIARINPRKHALTAAMLAALERANTPLTSIVGAWCLPLGPMPTGDLARPNGQYRGILHTLSGFVAPPGGRIQCHNYFPPGGGIDWHTDSGLPGWRVYVFLGREGTSTFHYQEHAFDEPAEGAYAFETGVGTWHAVESYRARFSCGLQLPEPLAQEIIAAAS